MNALVSPEPTTVRIDDPADPRVAAFMNIQERDLTGREGLFIAEGKVPVRILASPASRCGVRALLLAEGRAASMADVIAALGPSVPTYVASQAVLDGVAGFALHRGVLALGETPPLQDPSALLDQLPERALVLAVSAVGNHDNIGGLFRNAAALGADAVLLDDRCCDPFYRKAIRVSAGAVLTTPFARARSVGALVESLQGRGFEVLAMTPSAAADLTSLRRAPRTAVLVGSEGPGLDPAVIARCRPVAIPMAGGFDSLNVATSAAIALHNLRDHRIVSR